jgi:RNA polymerase sigma-70 factor (ECF subfamily)
MQERDDDALVAAIAGGDEAALRILVERWSPRVLAFATRALSRRADAEDLTQETFLRVYRAAPRYVAEGRFALWLFRIAGNLVRAELRRRKVRGWLLGASLQDDVEALEALPAPRGFSADAPLQDAETRAALAAALARLPDRQRLAVLLHYYEGLKLREVAGALGTSEHAAESLVARGAAGLRRALKSFLDNRA